METVDTLFLTHTVRSEEILLFSKKDLINGVSSMQNKEMLGSDGIPVEAFKAVTSSSPLGMLCILCL